MSNESETDRRSEPRFSIPSPVWWTVPGDNGVRRGRMVDVSVHGAAMLIPAEDSPAIGDRVNVSLIDPALALGSEVGRHLLGRATVCRLEPAAPSLNRVAFHFDGELWSQGHRRAWRDLSELVASPSPTPIRSSKAASMRCRTPRG
ncbi:MAG: PilZ domain-containing protein [Phycisphaerae bacterium]|nr:PilZ domain-containing protein [Phycisphaerae bacterium]